MFTKKITIPTLAIVVNVIAALVLVFTTATNNSVVYPALAQVNNDKNSTTTATNQTMEFAMAELAKLHLMVANQALVKNNVTAAFNQMNLAYLQLAMLGMKDMGTLNQTQAMKFMQGGGVKPPDIRMVPENCIIIQGGVLACRDILTGSYSLAK